MQLTSRDLQTFEAYKKAMRAAASQIKDKTPFCIYSDVQLPDASGKMHTLKPFLVVGSPVNAITPLLKNLKGAKAVACSGLCSLQGGKISFVAKGGKVNYGLFKSQATVFKELLGGKEILDPAHAGGAAPTAPAQPAKPAQAGAQPAKPAQAAAQAAAQPAKLTQAAVHWTGVRTTVDTKIKELKQVVKARYAKHPELLKEIDKNMLKIDAILDKLDHRLADSLKAGAAASAAARQAELRKTRTILDEYKRIVQSERLIAHIDQNPFGVKTNLKQTLMDSLKQAEQSMA
ncbi:MAG: hypothetical protein ACLQU1_36460 [Bryobacteraceae bacterium]